jgi:ATP-dependent DNA ligase
VYSECPSYDQLIPALVAHGVEKLPETCHFVVGVPIKPMLAKPTTGVSEVLTRFSDTEFSCEYKYDGERAQVRLNVPCMFPACSVNVPRWLKDMKLRCEYKYDGERAQVWLNVP